jgi:cytochrome P450
MTTSTSTAAPLLFDPYDYDFHEYPYAVYARLRDEAPLYYSERDDFWALSRHADVFAAFRDDVTYSNRMGVTLDASAWSPDAHRVMSFLALDGAAQTRIRKLVSAAFTPRRVRELEPQVQQLTEHYLERMLAANAEHGAADWIAELAGRLPMDVISEMMGVPVADRDEVRRLADLLVHREAGVRDVPPAGMEAAIELFGYYGDMVKQRRHQPTDDLTSALAQAELDGDRLTDQEIMAFLTLMVVAGNETTTKLLGNALFHLAAHPDQQAAVLDVDGDDLVAPWVEETLRHDNSTQMLARYVTTDVELHGRTMPAGSKLLLLVGAANRDERVFTDPDRYDVHRSKDELGESLSFGTGRHFCLGANLARLEARVVLSELVRRVEDFEVHADRAVRVHSVSVRGFAKLPVSFVERGGV